MGNHSFNVIVVLFWLATMSWLVAAKIVPPLRVGEPPNYAAILKESQDEPPVCWRIQLPDRTIGWAANKIVRRRDGISDLYSRVYLGEFPLQEFAPGWLEAMLKPVFGEFGAIDIEKQSRLMVDPLGRLIGFDSRVRIASIVDAIKVQGQIEGSMVNLAIQSGSVSYRFERYLPPNALMTDDLSPQTRMPGLRLGQTWTVPMYSPFRPPHNPMEILQATVEREHAIKWDGQVTKCRVIVYRDDPGSGLAGNHDRGQVWVRHDGVVLRQDISILRSELQFVRLSERESEGLLLALGPDWTAPLSSSAARRLLKKTEPDFRDAP